MAVTKFSAAGNHLWTRTAGHLGPFFTNSGDQIIRDPVGNLIAGGTFGGNSLTRDIGVTKISPDGAVFWTRTFDGAAHKGDDFFALAHHAGTGDVLVVGDTERSDGSGDPLIYRLDAHGNTLWSRTLGLANTTYDTFRDVTVDSSGNAYAVGKLAASTGGNWALTVKYAPDGATLWEDRYLGPTGGSSDWRHVLLTNAGGPAPTIHTSGDSFGSGTGQDLTTRQLTQPAPPPPPCMGDADGDLTVAFGDITSVLANFGASYPPGTSGAGDANFDDVVDFLDVTTVLANFETSCQ